MAMNSLKQPSQIASIELIQQSTPSANKSMLHLIEESATPFLLGIGEERLGI